MWNPHGGSWLVSGRPPLPKKPPGEKRRDYSFSKTRPAWPALGPQRTDSPLLPSGRRPRAVLRYTGCSPQTRTLLQSARRQGGDGKDTGELPELSRPWTQATLLPSTHTCGLLWGLQQTRPRLGFHSRGQEGPAPAWQLLLCVEVFQINTSVGSLPQPCRRP